MEGESYVRADEIDLDKLDMALERQRNRALLQSPYKERGKIERDGEREREEWEIDPQEIVLTRIVARGSFGTVYRGSFHLQEVAVKLLDWGEESTRTEEEINYLRHAFQQEVAVWHKLDHPNVTKFIGAAMGTSSIRFPSNEQGGDDGFLHIASNICCVVVEFLEGGTLRELLYQYRRKKLPFKTVMQLALDLSRGLSYLHSRSIVHRDVKSENMLLDKKRKLKIADFGVARVEALNPKDMTGETGTLGYMAPEVLDGKPYNRKCDVYSFGICLWEMYCCDMPYPDLSFAEMTSAVVKYNLRPEMPRCCPSALAYVMRKCWDGNPDKRPNMDEVVTMLETIDISKGQRMVPGDQPQCCFCFSRYHGL